jgi:hypothetical protein
MFPLLKPEFVVEGIVEAVLTNASFVSMPKTTYIYFFLKGFVLLVMCRGRRIQEASN